MTVRSGEERTAPTDRRVGPAKTVVLAHQWRRYTSTRERRARDQLVLAYSPIVKYAAGRLVIGMPPHVELADLVAYGLEGLTQAVERFDPARGIEFESYASTRIRGAIVDGIRKMDWVPRRVRDEARLVATATSALTTRLQRAPTDAELAKKLNIDAVELDATLQRLDETEVASLDQVHDAGRGGISTLCDSLADPDAVDPADSAGAGDLRARIAAAVELLPERERIVVGLRYTQDLSPGEIGDVLGVGESRVCQLHRTAVRRLRGILESEPLA